MANDFSGDANCVALFKFDNNATDSKGGNDLTAVNTPTYDGSDNKEGTYSTDLERDSIQYFTIADAALDADFPGKSGTSEQSFSIVGWFKPESVNVYQGLVTKYVSTGDKRSYAVVVNTSGFVVFLIGHTNGTSASNITFDTALTAGIWYHIAAVYNASDNSLTLRIWDDNAGALLNSNKTGSSAGDMSPTDAPLEIGRYGENNSYSQDGKSDEVVIFKDVLTDVEIDAIRAGTYGAGLTEKNASDTGAGVDAVESLQTPQAKTSADAGSGIEALIARLLTGSESGGAIEASSLETEGQLENLFASEQGEGGDQLVAKVETPVKGGGMKLWT